MSGAKKNFSPRFFSSEKFYGLTLFALACFGILLRLRHYLANRSLWLDEAMLALNILDRSFVGLTQQPMEYGQSSPLGFVFSVKAATLLFGDSEYAFRLFSLAAGCLAMILMTILAKRTLQKTGALFVVAFFASNPALVYYTAETKQYIGDVVVTLILLLLFKTHLEGQERPKDFALLGGLGALVLWFSHPALFVAASIGLVLVIHYARRREKWLPAIAALSLWGASEIAFYWFHLRHLASSDMLQGFWLDGFPPLPPTLGWFVTIWNKLAFDPLGIAIPSLAGLVFLLFALGMGTTLRRNRLWGAVLLTPLTLAMLAASIRVYPLIGRMLLFATPIFFLAIGAGLDALANAVKRPPIAQALTLVLAALLLYSPMHTSLELFRSPLYREHIKPTMAYLKNVLKENDTVYVYYYAEPAFRFYLPKYHLEGINYVAGGNHQDDAEGYLRELDTLAGKKRVWILFTHVYERGGLNEKDFMLAYLDKIGVKQREYRVAGTSVYLLLYDLSAAP
ncbi:MAG: hypothetical protein GXP40_11380 [Chloroflexi bacterium]|nr:hypothetical protein [Chloroflexota bacterium]